MKTDYFFGGSSTQFPTITSKTSDKKKLNKKNSESTIHVWPDAKKYSFLHFKCNDFAIYGVQVLRIFPFILM
jgi:hypothetical protein